MLEAARSWARLDPEDGRAAWAHGYALVQNGIEDQGFAEMERAMQLYAEPKELYADMAGVYLARGRMREGWQAYSLRAVQARNASAVGEWPVARPLPPDLSGKTFLLQPEQGLGDQLFFLRFAPLLQSRGARVAIVSSDKVRSILARASIGEILPEGGQPPTADMVVSVGSLPILLHAMQDESVSCLAKPGGFGPLTLQATRPRLPYRSELRIFYPELPVPLPLKPLPERLDAMRQRLAAYGPAPYLGLTWRAGIPPAEQRGRLWALHKEIPLLELGRCARSVDCTLVSLQRRPHPGEIQQLARAVGRPVHDLSELNEDLESMLAVLTLIDEYIGVSNTNTHLRAGVGASARVLIPQPPEWRWMAVGNESPWFPGFRIYRQGRDGGWATALARLTRDLEARWPTGR